MIPPSTIIFSTIFVPACKHPTVRYDKARLQRSTPIVYGPPIVPPQKGKIFGLLFTRSHWNARGKAPRRAFTNAFQLRYYNGEADDTALAVLLACAS